MNDQDIHAFTPATWPAQATASFPAAVPSPRYRRRVWPWLWGGLLLFAGLVLAAALVLLGLLDGAQEGLTFVVDGQPWRLGSAGDWSLDARTVLGAVVAALGVVLLLFMVLPVVLLVSLLGVAGVVLTVGLALAVGLGGLVLGLLGGVLGVVLGVVLSLSPLWGVVLLLWLLLRRRKTSVPSRTGAV